MTKLYKLKLSILLGVLTIGSTIPSLTQVNPRGEATVTYQWIRTNTQPGRCGCFALNGGGLSASWNVSPQWALAANLSAGSAGSGPSTGNSLTLVSYTTGLRYAFGMATFHANHAPRAFAQVLVGAAHAGGGIAGAGDGTYAFATRAGGGLDLPINATWSARLIQVDYLFSNFANAANNHQNNLLLGAGVVLRWSR